MGALNEVGGCPALPTAPLDPGNLFERGDVEVACAHLTVSQYGVSDLWYAIFMYCIPFLILVRYPCWNSQGLKQEFFPAASRRYRCRRLPRSETIQTFARGGLRRVRQSTPRRNASEDLGCRGARSRPDLRAAELDLKRSLQNTSTRGRQIAYGWNPKCGRMRCEHSNPYRPRCATSPIQKIFHDEFQ